ITEIGDIIWVTRIPDYIVDFSLAKQQQDIKGELLRRAQDYDRRGLSTDSLYVREQVRQTHITSSRLPSQRMAWLVDGDVNSLVECSMKIVKHHLSQQNYFQAELILEESVLLEDSHLRSSVVADLVGLYRQQVERLAAFDLGDCAISQVMLTRVARIDNDELAEGLFQCGCLGDFSMDDALAAAVEYGAINLAKRSLARAANTLELTTSSHPS
ncbi:MAG: hypothetical protein Q9183_004832, partial [Haloplaca sp. 2 TL-2023]